MFPDVGSWRSPLELITDACGSRSTIITNYALAARRRRCVFLTYQNEEPGYQSKKMSASSCTRMTGTIPTLENQVFLHFAPLAGVLPVLAPCAVFSLPLLTVISAPVCLGRIQWLGPIYFLVQISYFLFLYHYVRLKIDTDVNCSVKIAALLTNAALFSRVVVIDLS